MINIRTRVRVPSLHMIAGLLVGVLSIAGCAQTPELIIPSDRFDPRFAVNIAKPSVFAPDELLQAIEQSARLRSLASAPTTPTTEAPTPTPQQAPSADMGSLRLLGTVTLPKGLAGLANAQNGIVAGARVEVLDLTSGQRIGWGVTYYDGSYEAEVPANLGKRPALLQVMLVDGTTKKKLYPLESAIELSPELGEQDSDINPGTTAWVALLYALAAKAAQAPLPDWTQVVPGKAAMGLGSLIEGSHPDDQQNFASFSEIGGQFQSSTSSSQLYDAIQDLVARLMSGSKDASPVTPGDAGLPVAS